MAVAPFQMTSPLLAVSPNITTFTAGTTGNQTANTQFGNIRIAAGGSTVTVTNSLVTATSVIFVQPGTVDASNRFITSVVPGNGSFVITLSGTTTGEVNFFWGVFS